MPEEPIHNSQSDSDTAQRRSGGSDNDPHGGHEQAGHERKAPIPDPINELPTDHGKVPKPE